MRKLNRAWTTHKNDWFVNVNTHILTWSFIQLGQNMSNLNLSMFRTSLQNMMTDEQLAKWMPLVKNHRIMGCYAQTELGHGSDIAGLQTTATFDKDTDEFVIHTPTLTAAKWWPGDIG
jgi:acyl-CoA oxidase